MDVTQGWGAGAGVGSIAAHGLTSGPAVSDGRRHGHFPGMWQFYNLDGRGKLVAVKVAESHPVRHQLLKPHQQHESKQQQGCWQ
jgi:hypothetical protein